jgi:SAM-dependent methyltransferase
VVVVWLAVAAGSVWLLVRARQARRRRRAEERRGAVRPRPGTELPPDACAPRGEFGNAMPMSDDDLLAEQRAFYRARAPEYDEWWQRRGRYDRGTEQTAEWDRQITALNAAVTAFKPAGDVLELAGGTGWWTQRLADFADRLTVVDASAETIELNRRRVRRGDVEYVVADLFQWRPTRRYDTVFFSFWLSHVPRHRFGAFWDLVRDSLKPGGRAFLIDNRLDPSIGKPDPYVFEETDGVQRRRLNDGSEYRVVKVFYEPDELAALINAEGFDAAIEGTRWFVFGSAVPHAV